MLDQWRVNIIWLLSIHAENIQFYTRLQPQQHFQHLKCLPNTVLNLEIQSKLLRTMLLNSAPNNFRHGVRNVHPRSNGQAERFVDILKLSLKKFGGEETPTVALQTFLDVYRSTPNSKSPVESFIGRKNENSLWCHYKTTYYWTTIQRENGRTIQPEAWYTISKLDSTTRVLQKATSGTNFKISILI